MRPRFRSWFPFIIWSAAATACSGHSAESPAMTGPAVAKAGAVTVVGVGQPAEIRLEAQLGTGFSWTPKEGAALVRSAGESASNPQSVGGKEVQRFQFKSAHRGTYHLSFSYEQPWARGTKAARTERFTIEVR